jgi:hypothetical protein
VARIAGKDEVQMTLIWWDVVSPAVKVIERVVPPDTVQFSATPPMANWWMPGACPGRITVEFEPMVAGTPLSSV